MRKTVIILAAIACMLFTACTTIPKMNWKQGGIITTIVGNGKQGYSGDEGLALDASLNGPIGVTVEASGTIYIADFLNHRVRRVSPKGIISTFATIAADGNFEWTPSGPEHLALDKDGLIYVVDTGTHRILRIDSNGIPALITEGIWGIAIDSSGAMYITIGGSVLRREPNGFVHTFAGLGKPGGFAGDGGPAVLARLAEPGPSGVAVDSLGNVYIADTGNNRIRRVDKNGIISTFAGNGDQGYSGDGGPATDAKLHSPMAVMANQQGSIFILEAEQSTGHGRIRMVATDGIISTIAGGGNPAPGTNGDGGLASSACLHYPLGIALDVQGNIYVSEYGGQRIRKIVPVENGNQ